jgi:catechol 2,3-dioxygenase-like lactoylglutathione lyase family enzyme
MPVQLNHTIVAARDAEVSARWFTELFGLPEPEQWGHFWQVATDNGVGLDFMSVGDEPIASQHYAFLVSEEEFDAIHGGILERGLDHWADPGQRHPGQINHNDGGRGVYFLSNDGHYLEIITCPYGSGA